MGHAASGQSGTHSEVVALLYKVNAMYRQIFVDGRPVLDNPNPSWNGYSTARWEGDTLVVQTNGYGNSNAQIAALRVTGSGISGVS